MATRWSRTSCPATARRALEQRFLATVGRTPAATIRHIRLERAKHYLRDTDYSVGEIAHLCGFKSLEVLARVFKRYLGVTPSAFRHGAPDAGGTAVLDHPAATATP
jgi:transcriptional regulator GlxA family with amidase domain